MLAFVTSRLYLCEYPHNPVKTKIALDDAVIERDFRESTTILLDY